MMSRKKSEDIMCNGLFVDAKSLSFVWFSIVNAEACKARPQTEPYANG